VEKRRRLPKKSKRDAAEEGDEESSSRARDSAARDAVADDGTGESSARRAKDADAASSGGKDASDGTTRTTNEKYSNVLQNGSSNSTSSSFPEGARERAAAEAAHTAATAKMQDFLETRHGEERRQLAISRQAKKIISETAAMEAKAEKALDKSIEAAEHAHAAAQVAIYTEVVAFIAGAAGAITAFVGWKMDESQLPPSLRNSGAALEEALAPTSAGRRGGGRRRGPAAQPAQPGRAEKQPGSRITEPLRERGGTPAVSLAEPAGDQRSPETRGAPFEADNTSTSGRDTAQGQPSYLSGFGSHLSRLFGGFSSASDRDSGRAA